MAQTVIGLFESETEARQAAEKLEAAGISRSSVDVSRSSGYAQDSKGKQDHESGIVKFFKNLFGDSDDADRYSRLSNGGNYSVVTVHAQSADEAEQAANLLDEYGAVNVDERATQHSYESSSDGDSTINRVEEELQVGKREVESGGVRVRSRIVERPVEETLRLREEHVTVERNAVNRTLTAGESDAAFQEQDIELTERAEVPVVNKEARVVEEIKISKDVDQRTETIRDTVRSTEVDVDDVESRNTRRNENRSSL